MLATVIFALHVTKRWQYKWTVFNSEKQNAISNNRSIGFEMVVYICLFFRSTQEMSGPAKFNRQKTIDSRGAKERMQQLQKN